MGLTQFHIDVLASRSGTVGAYIHALFAVAVATALEFVIDRYVGDARYLTFLIPVIITATIGGLGASLFCLAVSVAAIHIFLPNPGFSWHDELVAMPAVGLFIIAALSTVTLITGMRFAIERRDLQEGRARLQVALDTAQLGWWHYDPRRLVASGDARYKQIFDVTGDEIRIEEFRELVHPDDAERFWADYSEMLNPAGPQRSTHEYRLQRTDGEVCWVRVSWLTHREGAGHDRQVTSVVGTVQDITGRKRRERLLQRQGDLLNQSHDAILTLQIGRRAIAYWSRGAERLYGYTAAEAEGCRTHELLQTRAPIPIEDIDAQIVHEGGWSGELTHTTRDGRDIVVESHIVRVSYDGETYALETNRDITDRKRAEEQVRLLLREMNHRGKNILSLVQAVARQTAASAPEDFIDRFTDRIQAIAANQDLLVQTSWKGVDVDGLVCAQLAHFSDLIGYRISMHGPKLRVNGAAAQAIGMALHELATNASKYGALSTDAGHVDIAWRTDDDVFKMNWTERNGPLVRPPDRRGFGTTVMESMAKRAVDGEVQLEYDPAGLSWRLTCPATNALELGA